MIKSIIAPVNAANVSREDKIDENEDVAALNAQTYSSTTRLLIGLIFQILCVICGAFPLLSAHSQFLQFQYISDGFWLEFGPIMAIALALAFSLLGSVWQFASILSFRSIPSAMIHAKNGFLSVLIVGCVLFLQCLIFSIILFTTNSFWEEPIKNNFNILLEAATVNPSAAEELNLLQLRFQCCGSTLNSTKLTIPSRFSSFQSFFNNFHPHHMSPMLQKSKSVPFSCCNRSSPSFYCFHLNLIPAIYQEKKFETFPSLSIPITREEALATLNSGTEASCPEVIFEAFKWKLFIFPAISFMILAFVCLMITLYGGYSLWNLRKLIEDEETTTAASVKNERPEVPNEMPVAPPIHDTPVSPAV